MLGVNAFFWVWLLSFLFYLLSFINSRFFRIFSVVFVFLCFLWAAFRSDDFPDYKEYEGIYELLASSDLFSEGFNIAHGELGFKLIAKALSLLSESPLILMVFFSVSSFLLLTKICRMASLSFPAVWLVYYSNSFLLKDFAQIRNAIASLLIVQAVVFFSKDKELKGFLSIVVAGFFFQYLAAIALVLRLFKGKFFWLLASVAILLSVLLFVIFDFQLLLSIFGERGYISQYNETTYVDPNSYSPWLAIFRVFFFITACLYLLGRVEGDFVKLLMASLVMSLCCYLAFSNVPILSQRLGGYFMSVDAFLCAFILKSNRKAASYFLVFYSFSIFCFNLLTRDFLEDGYKSIFQ